MQTRLGTALFREEWSESTRRDRRWSWREDGWAGWVELGSIICVCGFMVLSMLQEIQFTHLILCTGTDGAFPGRFNMVVSHQSAVQSYEDFVGQVRQQKRALLTTTSLPSITCYCMCLCVQVQAADSILVIGGGPTGVEMAAEIITEYPDKKVRCHYGNLWHQGLCHSGDLWLHRHVMAGFWCFVKFGNCWWGSEIKSMLIIWAPGGSGPLQNAASRPRAAADRPLSGQRGSAGERSRGSSRWQHTRKLCPGNFWLYPCLPDPLSILGHKVPNLSELKLNVTSKNMEVVSDKGERIRTDLIICCTGLRVNSSAYKSSFCQCTHPQMCTYIRYTTTYSILCTQTHRELSIATPRGPGNKLHFLDKHAE